MSIPIIYQKIVTTAFVNNAITEMSQFVNTTVSDLTQSVNTAVADMSQTVSNIDFLIDRIHWEPSVSEDPIKTLIPTGYSYAQIIYIGTDGTATTLTLSKTYSTGSVVLSTTKTSISGFSGIGVTFTPAITGGTQADFEIRYTKD
jgi:uncharacterized 2Fe-2S/4Fe-4S cluster protein (DUF4445 family)